MKTLNLTGYRRENGRVGIRNMVLIIPVDDISNAAAEGVAALIRGTYALSHPYGRLQFGEDLELTFDTLIGAGRNPNVAAVVVIGIEPAWADRIANGIAETGKPVEVSATFVYEPIQFVLDDIHLDEKLEDSLFELQAPKDYKPLHEELSQDANM